MLCMKHRCGSKIFGTKPARMWSNLMFKEEGPEAFELGYQQMQRIFSNDPERLAFIHELYQDPEKAHYSRKLSFTNAALVDTCESLFNVVKTWVMGTSRTSTSLLMSVVRTAAGLRRMIVKPFLKRPEVVKKVFSKTHNKSVL